MRQIQQQLYLLPHTLKWFSYDGAKSSDSGTITGDGKLQLSLYYARNQYDIAFKSYDGSETLYSYKGYYGTEITFQGNKPVIKDEDYIYTLSDGQQIRIHRMRFLHWER